MLKRTKLFIYSLKYDDLQIIKCIYYFEHIALRRIYKKLQRTMGGEKIRLKLHKMEKYGLVELTKSSPMVAFKKEGVNYKKIIEIIEKRIKYNFGK